MASLSGRISSVAWRDEYTGETHARLVPEDNSARKRNQGARIIGYFAHPLIAGECISVSGDWGTHDGERVLHVRAVKRIPPSTREGEVIALSSYIDGISKGLAAELLEKVGGLEALREICVKRPEKLDELLPGPRRKKARQHLRNFQWDRTELDPDLTATLHSVGRDLEDGRGISTTQIQRMIRHFGAGPLRTILQTRPYDLVDVQGIGFSTADKIAFHYATQQGRKFDPLDPERLRHGVRDVVARERGSGHVCMPEDYLVSRALLTLRSPDGKRLPPGKETEARLREAVSQCLKNRHLVKEFDQIYTLGLHKAETELAMIVAKMIRAAPPASKSDVRKIKRYLEHEQEKTGIVLTDEQEAAVEMAVTQPISILTGGPGVGKTLTSSRIVGAIKALHRTFQVLAPTGKAAKRASDVIGEEASTIHRACHLDMQEDVHAPRYGRRLTRFDYFRVDYLIVDEASMLDLTLGFELLRRIKPGHTRVIFIGDIDQLPPVGAGQVFRDLLQSGVIPVTRLTKVQRQKGGSPIVDCAYEINAGQPPSKFQDGNEVRILNPRSSKDFIPSSDDKANEELEARIIEKWLLYSIKKYTEDLGIDGAKDIQVYAPERAGPVGINRLNLILREYFNPVPPDVSRARGACIKIQGGYIVQPGCKVMQAQNDYRLRYAEGAPDEAYEAFQVRLQQEEKDKRRRSRKKVATAQSRAERDVIPVMNGQIGYVVRVDPQLGELEVKFDDLEYPVLYRHSSEWGKLVPAWAMSIHKSQGSETPYAFIVLHSGMYMINRPLLYTGWTRAKKGVLLIATPDVVQRAVTSLQGTERYTNLSQRLRETVRG